MQVEQTRWSLKDRGITEWLQLKATGCAHTCTLLRVTQHRLWAPGRLRGSIIWGKPNVSFSLCKAENISNLLSRRTPQEILINSPCWWQLIWQHAFLLLLHVLGCCFVRAGGILTRIYLEGFHPSIQLLKFIGKTSSSYYDTRLLLTDRKSELCVLQHPFL